MFLKIFLPIQFRDNFFKPSEIESINNELFLSIKIKLKRNVFKKYFLLFSIKEMKWG